MSRGDSLIAVKVFPEIAEKLRQGEVVTTVQIRDTLVRNDFSGMSFYAVTASMRAGYFEEVTGIKTGVENYRGNKLYFDAGQAFNSEVTEEKARRKLEIDERKAR